MGRGYPYGCPHRLSFYIDIHTDIRADVHVELSVLRTVRPRQTTGTFQAKSHFVRATVSAWIFALFLRISARNRTDSRGCTDNWARISAPAWIIWHEYPLVSADTHEAISPVSARMLNVRTVRLRKRIMENKKKRGEERAFPRNVGSLFDECSPRAHPPPSPWSASTGMNPIYPDGLLFPHRRNSQPHSCISPGRRLILWHSR